MRKISLTWLLMLTACTPQPIVMAAGVPTDTVESISAAWNSFSAALPNVSQCMPEVRLVVDAVASSGDAEYLYNTQEIRMTPSDEPAESTIIHELAHHADATCGMPTDERAAFLAAQGFPPEAAWDCGETWEMTPAEHFAEAVVMVVTGTQPSESIIELSAESLDLIRNWESES